MELPTIQTSDFHFERLLGEGSFADVFQVSFCHNKNYPLTDAAHSNIRPRQINGINKFALKCPKKNAEMTQEENQRANDDLISEACVLSKLQHKHIIKAMGISAIGEPAMLLLEILECTLEDRLQYWRAQDIKTTSEGSLLRSESNTCRTSRRSKTIPSLSWRSILNRRREHETVFLSRTKPIVTGIASALDFIHSKGIILRDLKPQNIGFTSTGEIKLFDFGLACHINDSDCENVAGSLRYMPPELLCRTANLLFNQSENNNKNDSSLHVSSKSLCSFATDVYSFGIVLWEVATLEKAFSPLLLSKPQKQPSSVLFKQVFQKGWRPSTGSIPSKYYRRLIKECWHTCPVARPSLSSVCSTWLPKIYPSTTITAAKPTAETMGGLSSSLRRQILEEIGKGKIGDKNEARINLNGNKTKRCLLRWNSVPERLGKYSLSFLVATAGSQEDNVCCSKVPNVPLQKSNTMLGRRRQQSNMPCHEQLLALDESDGNCDCDCDCEEYNFSSTSSSVSSSPQ